MSKKSRRRRLLQLHGDTRLRDLNARWDLEEGRWAYNWNNGVSAMRHLLAAWDAVINEPDFNSQEYRNGERFTPPPDSEQEEKEDRQNLYEHLFREDFNGSEAERDEEGYLIR